MRTSTVRRQGERDGLERQQRCIERYAREHGIDVVETFQDKVSGTRELDDREGLSALFQRLDENSGLVLIERSDRLARDVMVSEVLLRQLADRAVHVITADSGTDLTVADGDATPEAAAAAARVRRGVREDRDLVSGCCRPGPRSDGAGNGRKDRHRSRRMLPNASHAAAARSA